MQSKRHTHVCWVRSVAGGVSWLERRSDGLNRGSPVAAAAVCLALTLTLRPSRRSLRPRSACPPRLAATFGGYCSPPPTPCPPVAGERNAKERAGQTPSSEPKERLTNATEKWTVSPRTPKRY
ncbi:hypothetical protein O3P69_020493 [Scylla paramamosain]|uniref:Uncharacterized protein n=1 Tax=Scylla paramamosain TaxID=85552 RepID=A0AAW0TM91_SCYPA